MKTIEITEDTKLALDTIVQKFGSEQSESWIIAFLIAMYNDVAEKIPAIDQVEYLREADLLNKT